jgi:hypothetical protein
VPLLLPEGQVSAMFLLWILEYWKFGMAFNDKMFIPNFVKIGELVQILDCGTHT